MNNEISNKPCGCGNCEPMCTTCGRPWVVCKGECSCNKPCCNKVNFCEYGRAVPGCIRGRAPECPMQAVIPSVVVESTSNLKNLADCFVHVTDINTTFYIDDKHRTMITWAGPVEYNSYDLDANSLGLRSQFLLDFANDRGAYYDKTGNYKVFNFGEGDTSTVRLSVRWESTASWHNVDIDRPDITRFLISDVDFLNEETQESLNTGEVFALLEAGTKVILDHVPLGAYYSTEDEIIAATTVDGVELSTKVTDLFSDDVSPWYSYTGGAFVMPIDAHFPTYYGVGIQKGGSSDEYSFYVQGLQGSVN